MSSSSSAIPGVCLSCATRECFCDLYRPRAVYSAPPEGGVLDLDEPVLVLPESEHVAMSFSDSLIVNGVLTEGWATPIGPLSFNGDPRLYYSLDLGVWTLSYTRLALDPELALTSGLFTFYEFVNCVDGCDGLLYIDTCGEYILYLECSTVSTALLYVECGSSASSSSSLL